MVINDYIIHDIMDCLHSEILECWEWHCVEFDIDFCYVSLFNLYYTTCDDIIKNIFKLNKW